MDVNLFTKFSDIEPSIIDTVLETVSGSNYTAAEWLSSNANTDSDKANSPSYDVQGKENLGTPVAIKFEYHVNDENENDSTKTGSLNQALSDIPVHPFSESLTSLFTSDVQQRKKPVISFSRAPLQQLQNFVANQLDSSGVNKASIQLSESISSQTAMSKLREIDIACNSCGRRQPRPEKDNLEKNFCVFCGELFQKRRYSRY